MNTWIVPVLLEAGADPNAPDPDGNTPLHLAVVSERNHSLPAIRGLLEAGADPNVFDPDGNTPLHLAVLKEEEGELAGPIIAALLAAAADVHAHDAEGRTPWDLALERGKSDAEFKASDGYWALNEARFRERLGPGPIPSGQFGVTPCESTTLQAVPRGPRPPQMAQDVVFSIDGRGRFLDNIFIERL